MLSQAVEDYLKTIYKLQGEGAVSTTEIAREMNVSSASVTNMIKRLASLGLVSHQSYRGVSLTEPGEKVALEIIRHHRLLELYLKEVLGYSWQQLHEEAEHLEHHISEDFERKIEEMLGFPTHDPHGDPIPTREGEMGQAPGFPLANVAAGDTVVVRRVSDEDVDLLHYLEELGLMPGRSVRVIKKAPFDGPLTLHIGEREEIVGQAVARSVFVAEN